MKLNNWVIPRQSAVQEQYWLLRKEVKRYSMHVDMPEQKLSSLKLSKSQCADLHKPCDRRSHEDD